MGLRDKMSSFSFKLVRKLSSQVRILEQQQLQKDLKTLHKDLKIKEKYIYRLQIIEDNSKETIKSLKGKNLELSREKKKGGKSKQKS